MGEFDFDVVSDVSDAGARRRPGAPGAPLQPIEPPPRPAEGQPRDRDGKKNTGS